MKDPNKKLREAYGAVLDGNIFYEGRPVRVFDSVLMPGYQFRYPVIVITEQTNIIFNNAKTACGDLYEPTILLRILSDDYKGQEMVDEVAAQIYTLLETYPDLSPVFTLQHISLESDNTIGPQLEEGNTIGIVRDIRFRNQITVN